MIIGICDDQPEVGKILAEQIEELLEQWNVLCDIRIYNTGEKLLKEIKELSLVFLDIEMPKLDGIEVGKRIKKLAPNCKIVMASGMVERFEETYAINAVRFITKPYNIEKVAESLRSTIIDLPGSQTIQVYRERRVYDMVQNEIRYIKAYNGYVEIVSGTEIYRRDITIQKLMELLDQRIFFQIRRGCVINFHWIEWHYKNQLRIEGETFTVSRRQYKEFEQRYMDYDLMYGWW